MNIRTHSEAGGKIENEDFLLVKRHPENSVVIVALADGQGGRAHGAAAARAACEAVWEAASALASEELFKDGTWQRIIASVDRAAAVTGGFTTLVALALDDSFAAGASCGDSKAYFHHRHEGYELAEWTTHQPKNPPIGSECANAEPFMCTAIGGGRLIVVSDGVWKYCGYEALKAACGVPLEQVVEHLRSTAVARSGAALPDDFSLVVVDLE